MTESVIIPTGHDSEKHVICTSASMELPPAEYLSIVRALPSSVLEQGKPKMQIIQDYISSFKVSDEVTAYVQMFANAKPSSTLDDAAVIDYLASKYGVITNDLSTLSAQPTTDKEVFAMSMTNLDAELLKGSAQDLLSAFEETSGTELTTLDEVIEKYCESNKIDLSCSIENLLDSIIYDKHPTPMSVKDLVLKHAKTHNISMDTTLNEFVNDIEHKDVDDVDIVLDFLEEFKGLFPEEYYPKIREGIINNEHITFDKEETFTPATAYVQTLLQYLNGDEKVIEDVVAIADSNGYRGEEFRATLKSKVDIEDVLATLGLDSKSSERFIDALKNNEMFSTCTCGPDCHGKDLGYKAGELMLRKVRETLAKDASFETRNKYTPILYTFLRMLMSDMSKEKDSVIEFIDNKIKESPQESKDILTKAKNLLI